MGVNKDLLAAMGKRRAATVPKKREPKPAAEPKTPRRVGKATEDLTEQERGFRERAAADVKRTRLAMDAEFWCTIGFDDAADRDRFVAAAGVAVDEHYRADGYLFVQSVGIPVTFSDDLDTYKPPPLDDEAPEKPADAMARLRSAASRVPRLAPARLGHADRVTARQAAATISAKPPPSPLADVVWSEDLQEHCAAELAAMLAAMEAPPRTDHLFTTDRPYWIVVVFTCQAHKDAALVAAELFRHGDKYLDGYVVAEKLGISMTE